MANFRTRWLRTTSLQFRLILAFTFILVLLLVVAGIAIERFHMLTKNTHELVDIQARNAQQTQALFHHSQASAIDLLRILQTEDRERRVDLYKSMDAAIKSADTALLSLKESANDIAHVMPVSDLREQYRKAFNSTVEMLEVDSLASAKAHFESKTGPVLKRLLTHTMALDAQQQASMQLKTARLQEEADDARIAIVIIGLTALLTGLGLATFIARTISQPVKQAVQLATCIADGDYSANLPKTRLLEIQTLFKALRRMRESIIQREQRITRLAYTDTLTGLNNRTRFLECLEEAIEQSHGALVVFNINRFANYNQALGHHVADEILQKIATSLSQSTHKNDCAARLDSDRFALLLINYNDSHPVESRTQELLQHINQPIDLHGQRLDVEARAGIARFPQDSTSAIHLMQMAGNALDQAKIRYLSLAFADPCEESMGLEQLSLLGEMHKALNEGEFVLAYQPKTKTSDGHIKGVEALIRWQHPEKGTISPALFIPFAEQTGFIRNLTPWIIDQALKDAKHWFDNGHTLVVSVNISTLDLNNPEFSTLVQTALQNSQLPANTLCLEITESALMIEPEQALKHLKELASLGVKLAIDDYGTGQASLSYVKDLPVHELKIDRAFVSGVDQQSKQAAIVGATIMMCEQLGLEVVAEGVETDAEARWLTDQHCHLLQGFGIARPMPAEALQDWITQHSTP